MLLFLKKGLSLKVVFALCWIPPLHPHSWGLERLSIFHFWTVTTDCTSVYLPLPSSPNYCQSHLSNILIKSCCSVPTSSEENKPFRTVDMACSERLPSSRLGLTQILFQHAPSVHMCFRPRLRAFPEPPLCPPPIHSNFLSQLQTTTLMSRPRSHQAVETTSTTSTALWLKPLDYILMVFHDYLSPGHGSSHLSVLRPGLL